jgi:hypothetical protein
VLRFKAFGGADASSVEEAINKWLLHTEPDVKLMQQSLAASGALTVSFLYDEGFTATEQRMSVEAAEIVDRAMREEPILEPVQVDQEQV